MDDLFTSAKAPPTNTPELSVSDLAGALKRTLEDSFGRVRVRGELSKVAFPASGHMYSALKDENAVIDAVCWRGQLSKLKIKPAEGLEVICTGRITTYPARSSYQLIIEQMELAGIGALLKMIEDRRIKLMAEGLFDEKRKRPLPLTPRVIGIITSPTGAVIRDILHRLSDRFPVHVIIWPTTVQGDRAAREITTAINGFNALIGNDSIPRPELLIVARGGGSIEDLMPFNDEDLVRTAAQSTIPLISAVGHETDTTLIDYAADRRAPTPTAAAEFAVPVHADLVFTVENFGLRLTNGLARRAREDRARLETLQAHLSHSDRLLEHPTQKLDYTTLALTRALQTRLERLQARLNQTAARLIHPTRFLAEQRRLLQIHEQALARAAQNLIRPHEQRLEQSGRLLETLSFHQVLKRGFAVIRTPNGQIITTGTATNTGDRIEILFGDATIQTATID